MGKWQPLHACASCRFGLASLLTALARLHLMVCKNEGPAYRKFLIRRIAPDLDSPAANIHDESESPSFTSVVLVLCTTLRAGKSNMTYFKATPSTPSKFQKIEAKRGLPAAPITTSVGFLYPTSSTQFCPAVKRSFPKPSRT